MYLAHYGLQNKPFESAIDPERLWLSEKHQRELVYLKHGLSQNNGFTVITGDIGTGKTTLVRWLVKSIGGSPLVVNVPDPQMERLDFFNFIADALNMHQVFESKADFLRHFKRYLRTAFSNDQKILLIVDEAQRLSHELLQDIRLLLNIDMSLRMPLKPILVGLTEFEAILEQPANRNVKQRVTANLHIEPFSEKETRAYVAHRLRIAGSARIFFTPAALKLIHSHTAGIPRAINALCDHAMVTGYVTGQQSINTEIILECLKELSIIFSGGSPDAGVEEKVESSDDGSGDAATVVARPVPKSQRTNRFFPIHRFGIALALVLLLCLGGYVFRGQLYDLAPSKSKNEQAVQQVADILELQPDNSEQRSFSDHPFGHQMAEDAAAADIVEDPQLTKASGFDRLVIRKKIELPAAETGEGFKDLDR